MATSFSTAVKTARANALVTQAGTNPTITFYNGTKPASLGAVSTQTALAVLTFSGTLGTVSNGVLTFSATSQNNANHVAGSPTWVRIATSGGVAVADMDVGSGNQSLQFNGTVAIGVNVTLNASTYTEGN
jgi:hypothetical protein